MQPARLAFTADGTPWSAAYEDVYHSIDGAPGQAHHVFLGGNALPARWRGRSRFVVVETGFGIGLNFLATWAALRADSDAPRRLHFISVEKHPFAREDLAALHARWPQFAPLSAELLRDWPPLTAGFHRLELDRGRVALTLAFGDALECLQGLVARADAFFLDGFAPARNPEMWSPELMRRLARCAAPGATLATWSVAAPVREALQAAGFATEKRPGFGHKREMLCGRRVGEASVEAPLERHAIVIGAGVAGTTLVERLATRGWEVDLFERHGGPAQEASGNHAGVLRPMLSRDDNIGSRLSRAGYLHALRQLHALERDGAGVRWAPCGVLQLARSPAHEALQREAVTRHAFPAEFVRYLEHPAAQRAAGAALETGGWFFAGGGWLNPPSLCEALLARAGPRLRPHFGIEVAAIARDGRDWIALDRDGAPLARAPRLILANAADAARLAPPGLPRLERVRGQVSHLPAAALPDLAVVLCREGYVSPPWAGIACVGASFDFDDADPSPRASGHAGNLTRLARLLPGAAAGIDPAALDGRVGFRTATPDRLPLVGALPDAASLRGPRAPHLDRIARLPGLYCATGYGARGLVWAPLAAELLAAQIEEEPLPLPRDLIAAIDPARFLVRRLRRSAAFAPCSQPQPE